MVILILILIINLIIHLYINYLKDILIVMGKNKIVYGYDFIYIIYFNMKFIIFELVNHVNLLL